VLEPLNELNLIMLQLQFLKEHELYSTHHPQVCWRIINPGKRTATLEIDLLHPLISAATIAAANTVPSTENNNLQHQFVPTHSAPSVGPSSTIQYSYNGFHESNPSVNANAPPLVAASAYPQISPPPSYTLPASHQASNDHLIYVNQPQQMRQGLLNTQYQYE